MQTFPIKPLGFVVHGSCDLVVKVFSIECITSKWIFFLFKACSFLILITELPPKGKVTKNLILHLLVSVISTRFEV